MPTRIGRHLVALAGAAVGILAASLAAQAECRAVTVGATGPIKRAISEATSAASKALGFRIAKTYGTGWSVGSHRNGEFTCKQVAPSPRPGWTCSPTTTSICRPQ